MSTAGDAMIVSPTRLLRALPNNPGFASPGFMTARCKSTRGFQAIASVVCFLGSARSSISRLGSDSLVGIRVGAAGRVFEAELWIQIERRNSVMPHVYSLVAFVLPILAQVPDKVDALQTVAERSDYRATARYDDVEAWCREFAKRTPNVHLTELGRSSEGRSIPLMIVADPPVKTAAEAARFRKADLSHHRQHPCWRSLRQGGAADAAPRAFRGRASATPEKRDPRRGADLQHRRQRTRLENQSARPARPGGRNGPARQCARARPESRLHQARGTGDAGIGALSQRVEPPSFHRYAHDQRLSPSLHDHLRRAQEPGRRSQDRGIHAADVLPRGRCRIHQT